MTEAAEAVAEQEVKPKKTRGSKLGGTSAPAAEGGEKKERKVGVRGSAKFSMDALITVLVEKNPKQAQSKSYIRFEEYKTGMSCKDAIANGVLLADLYYDSQHGFIKIDGYDAPPLERKPRVKKEAAPAEAAPESVEA
jgi:hypothetical protein